MRRSRHLTCTDQKIVKARSAVCNEALASLKTWRSKYLVKGLSPLIWEYEYKQVHHTVKLLERLVDNLKGLDTREH